MNEMAPSHFGEWEHYSVAIQVGSCAVGGGEQVRDYDEGILFGEFFENFFAVVPFAF